MVKVKGIVLAKLLLSRCLIVLSLCRPLETLDVIIRVLNIDLRTKKWRSKISPSLNLVWRGSNFQTYTIWRANTCWVLFDRKALYG